MATTAHRDTLHDTEDFVVESADGPIGRVEEIWLGPADKPQALAVRMKDGSHALLLDREVLTVDREHRWVVVRSGPELLELGSPRLDGNRDGKLTASWATTGTVVRPELPKRRPTLRLVKPHPSVAERPLWQVIAILYSAVTLVVLLVLGLVFLISWLAGGAPY
jgi:hypothetical protein